MKTIVNSIVGAAFMLARSLLYTACINKLADILLFLAAPISLFWLLFLVTGCLFAFRAVIMAKKDSYEIYSIARAITGAGFLVSGSVFVTILLEGVEPFTFLLTLCLISGMIVYGTTLCLMAVFGKPNKRQKKKRSPPKRELIK